MNRRIRAIHTALIVATLGSTLAVAGGKHLHRSNGDYSWIDDDRALSLHANETTHGVVVDRTRPTPLYGLRGGDVIVAVDGRAIDRLDPLLDAMHRHARSPATLAIRRAGAEVIVSLPDAGVRMMFPPPPLPPAPPSPPAAPRPPAPPAPPAAPAPPAPPRG